MPGSFGKLARSFALVAASCAALTAAVAGSGYWIWHKRTLQTWAETSLIRVYFDRIRGTLPFDVERVRIRKTWAGLLAGRVDELAVTLRRGGLRAELRGPLLFPPASLATVREIYRKLRGEAPLPRPRSRHGGAQGTDDELRVDYDPVATIQRERGRATLARIPLHLWAIAAPELDEIREAGVETLPGTPDESWTWSGGTVTLHQPSLRAGWDRGRLDLRWSARAGEARLDGRALSIPSELLEGELTANGAGPSLPHEFRVALGPDDSARRLRIAGRLEASASAFDLRWALPALPATEALRTIRAATSRAEMPDLKIERGTLALRGHARLRLTGAPALTDLGVRLELRDLAMLWPSSGIALRGLAVTLLDSSDGSLRGTIAVDRFGWRGLRGTLAETPIVARPRGRSGRFLVRIGRDGAALPLFVEGLPLQMMPLTGWMTESPRGLDYRLRTAVEMEAVELADLLHPLCAAQPGDRIPPVTARVHFPTVTLTPDSIGVTGFARAAIFGGYIQADGLAMRDPFGDAPELDFSVAADGIRLDLLGDWVGFGKMDGILTGYMRDTVLQSWLPARYDFEARVRPFLHDNVVFSTEAMKNFSRIFAGEGIDRLPWFVRWISFGPLSQLLGGYNVDYAGIHIRAADDQIRLETLDRWGRETAGNHFILYGSRFKIRLPSPHYPLVLNALAMRDFAHRTLTELSDLQAGQRAKEMEKRKKGRSHEPEFETDPAQASCVDPDLAHL